MHRLRGSLFDLRREVKRQMEKSCDFIASFKQPLAQCIADIDDDMYALCQDLAKCKVAMCPCVVRSRCGCTELER